VARDEARASELRIKREKEITEIREKQARANNFNFLSKEITGQDPTIALRLAEHALGLDPKNRTILSNLNSIYYDNTFYRIFFTYSPGNFCQVSPDGKKIITTNGRTARLTDLDGKDSHVFIGHIVNGLNLVDMHQFTRSGFDDIVSITFSPDGSHVLTCSSDRTARLWISRGIPFSF